MISRRTMLAAAALAPTGLAPSTAAVLRAAEPDLSGLATMTGGARTIDAAEYGRRLSRARALMKANGIGAVLVEAGSSLQYFTGVRWSRSERLTAAVIPADGDPVIVTPFFEEPSVRETMAIPARVRTWPEDENPLALVATILRERGLARRPVGIEEMTRYFAVEGLAAALGRPRIVSANPVVRGVRMVKSPAEIALMKLATDVTVAAYRWTYPRVEAGMTGPDITALMTAAMRRLGGEPQFAMALVGEASAYPHGSAKVTRVADGQVVLMDSGCTVHGYQSDVSRTWVHGRPTVEQARVWNHVAKGQQLAFRTARLGIPAGAVDDAVRLYYTGLGYGPDYRLPGLSHRTGHGIGLDGHEPVNLVRGETTRLAAGMCFSDEPGLYLPGRFGVRLEDCFHMTATGPEWFSVPPASLDSPV